jgi:hypothetical protein
MFALLQHRRPPLNERAHGVFGVVFESYPERCRSLFPRYLDLSLEGYPAITQSAGFEQALRILLRGLSATPASSSDAVSSRTRLLDEPPWLQFTSECQRFGPPPRLDN